MEQGNKLALSKLKLLYIFNYFSVPLTNTEVTNFVLENNFMDYFLLQQIFTNLYESKFIELYIKNGHEYYYLTDEGINAINMFENILPNYFIEEVKSKFDKAQKNLKKKSELFGHYYKKSESEYIVSFQVLENRTAIFNLSMNVPTEDLAKSICQKWNLDSDNIFRNILKILTSDLPKEDN
ncbi:DUF4364 family protein [Sedimentibacter sp. zth1]|uniref:DUF4364 family protein n=1 Tax=Sedimentibacter sp. zth1 TaxID=2816908 RepID=UPI001A9117EF|nr:DUF4364 family protein [Sedimentibacter sp. zth1]QSX06890.1 DUF4364 family protein [Sedimentibacter sp. zth1]